jgi:Kdo2-lipid IVA lauroyltransferase/acyltransferase
MDQTLLWQRFLAAVMQNGAGKIERMPRERALRLGARLGRLGFAVVKRSRRSALRNLALAYGDTLTETERLALTRRVFEHFGKVTIDFVRTRALRPEAILKLISEIEGWDENAMAALALNKGLIAVSGHFGNFELFARFSVLQNVPLAIIVRDPENALFGDYVKRLRESSGYEVLSKGGSGRRLLQVLKENKVLGILPDQNSGDVFVPFFGCPAGTPDGPAQLALRTGAPIVPAFCHLKPDNTYKITIKPPILIKPTGDKLADITRAMTLVNLAIEEMVRQHPEQWLWLHNRWKASFEEKNRSRWPSGFDYDALRSRWER